MKGASTPPRRPMKDDSPDAWVIMLVGNSSGVTKKTAPNVPDALTMPSIADTTDSVLRASIYALLLVVLFFLYLSAEVFGEASRAVKRKTSIRSLCCCEVIGMRKVLRCRY